MLDWILLIALVFYLTNREKRSIFGSPALMAITMGVIGLGGYFATIVLLPDQAIIHWPFWIFTILLYGWVGLGYATHVLVNNLREKAYYRRLNSEVE